MRYRALSVVAPAGGWIREGRKTVEVRRWIPDVLPLLDLVIVENAMRLSAGGVSRDPEGIAGRLGRCLARQRVDEGSTRGRLRQHVGRRLVRLASDKPTCHRPARARPGRTTDL